MTQNISVEALSRRLYRAVDGLDGTAQFREPSEVPIRRGHASHLDPGAGRGDLIQVCGQTLEIGRVLGRVDETLPEEPHEVLSLLAGAADLPNGPMEPPAGRQGASNLTVFQKANQEPHFLAPR